MKKIFLLLFSTVLLLSCSGGKQKTIELQSEADLAGLRVGVSTGGFHDIHLTPRNDIELHRFMTPSDDLQALLTDKVDVMLEDEIIFSAVIRKEQCLKIALKEPFLFPTALVFNKNNEELTQACNEVQKEMEQDGRMAQIKDLWINEKYTSIKSYPEVPPQPQGKPLKVVTSTSIAPLSFMVGNEWYGIEVDIARALGAKLNRPLEIKYIDFSSAIIALNTGAADIMIGGIFVTDERKQMFLFADPYHEFTGAYYVIDKEAKHKNSGFLPWLKKSFERNLLVEKRWLFIVQGLWETVKISIFAILFGSLLGIGLFLMMRSRRKWLVKIAAGYNWVVAGIPQLVLLLILFYVFFSNSGLSPSIVAIIAFAMTFASSAADIYGTSLDAIPHGQTEAGLALGFTRMQTFTNIVLPQAIRRGLPLFKGQCINLLKGTSIVGYIAIQDITRAGDIIRSRTFDAFVPLLIVTILYFLLAWLLGKLIELALPKNKVL